MKYKPDEAEIWLGISIVKQTAEAAQNEANTVINDVIDGLRSKGIQDKDIQTEQLSLYEERSYTETEGSKIIGWRASQTLRVKTLDLSKVGTIVDVAIENGVNQINSINFGLSPTKEEEYKKIALAEASKNAKGKAETIANSLGVNLGDIKSVSEGSFDYVPYVYTLKAGAPVDAAKEVATVLPSDVTITASISLVYNIK